MEKKCNCCGEFKNVSEFGKCKNNKDNLDGQCKRCKKLYRDENKEYIKQYRLDNKDKHKNQYSLYYNTHKKETALRCDTYQKSDAKYYLFYDKLTIDESPKLAEDSVSLEVKCRYCGNYFIPNRRDTKNRINAINSVGKANFLYCSNNCKAACPVYKQKNYPKGFKVATSREVNPLVRQLCFERDNWTCQSCGATQSEAPLHCHHIEGYAQNPRLGNDVANTITLCKTCHKEVHKLPGCGYNDLRCDDNLDLN